MLRTGRVRTMQIILPLKIIGNFIDSRANGFDLERVFLAGHTYCGPLLREYVLQHENRWIFLVATSYELHTCNIFISFILIQPFWSLALLASS